MYKQWVVMFDCAGVDTLIPCDEMKTRDMLEWLGGKKFKSELHSLLTYLTLRARHNQHRGPEIWAYECHEDYSQEQMQEIWQEAPQRMADLVRAKGSCLFKSVSDKQLIH